MLRGLKQFNLPEIEEKVLKFWKENDVFKKSLAIRPPQMRGKQVRGKKTKVFRFFEGPPTANGRPGLHHVLARAFKDIICRFKTMSGFFVSRRAGWDTHGLPVELEIEKKLGLKNKQEIEKFGIAEFNAQAKMSVWTYKSEWEKLTERVGFWLDFDHPYVTYENSYIETLWWIFGQIAKRGLLKKLYKIVPWCPRCQTPLSSHELGQPGAYRLTKDPSVYVKFALRQAQGRPIKTKEFLLVWTTTPWTLPANVAVAVNPKLTYTKYRIGDEYIWSYSVPPKSSFAESSADAKALADRSAGAIEVIEKISGNKLVGLDYEPLYKVSGYKLQDSGFKVIAADFVSTEEGTGLVHIAPAYGEDDLEAVSSIKYQVSSIPITIDDRGFVNKGLPGEGKFIKEADADIIADLEKRNVLYSKGIVEHEYPFCWRCSTPLIYFARNSWFIEMSKLRDELIAANKKINWIPEHIKEGRFGEWLKDLKDWAISRERYWGTPLPIWTHANSALPAIASSNANAPMRIGKTGQCDNVLVVGSLEDLNKYAYNRNRFFIARHGESDHNIANTFAAGPEKDGNGSKLTKKGIAEIEKNAKAIKKTGIDIIYSSPFIRAQETAKIYSRLTGAKIVTDKRLNELNPGKFSNRPVSEYYSFFKDDLERFMKVPLGGENLNDVKKRMMEFLRETDKNHEGQKILIVSHGDPLWVLEGAIKGLKNEEIAGTDNLKPGEYKELECNNWPFNKEGELDIHRPFIDEVYLKCSECGGKMARIKEVADVWFDSGAMPFAQWHYPFENKKLIDGGAQFPADYIAEGMDQTRGWFYTLLAVSTLLGRGLSYRNVISFGLLLDKNAQKMSKSKGNVVDPWQMIQKYGADVVRWYFYTVNPPGEPKRFDENDLRKTFNKLFMLVYNSFVFYKTYGEEKSRPNKVLDEWIIARLNEVVGATTKNLDKYEVGEAAKTIEGLVDDLSRWYIRRSRKNVSGETLNIVLSTLSKLIAPFAPFFSEALYQSLRGPRGLDADSVHLADWPEKVSGSKIEDSRKLLEVMAEVRRLASLALAEREKAGIKVRQPLAKLSIKYKVLSIKYGELLELLKDEINVKEIKFDSKIQGEIELDTKITPELRNEGILRELARMIQGLRKDAGLQPENIIALYIEAPKELRDVLESDLAKLKKDVKAKTIEFRKSTKFIAELNTKMEEWPVWFAIDKLG